MKTLHTRSSLQHALQPARERGLRIAFVPTMGALHPGHIALIHHAKTIADVVVCSIFVNPTQFNDPKDLEKYPRPLETDIRLLQAAACDVLFHPEVTEMYGSSETWQLDLGHLDQVLEGLHRPGHFQGVTQIVKKLLDAVRPDVACFGQKDFQQYKVVEQMVRTLQLPVRLEMCPTVREADGLAMSSRNVRLTPQGRQQALALYRTLLSTKANLGAKSLDILRKEAIETLQGSPGVELEYFAIYNSDTFTDATEDTGGPLVALVAAWVAGVRLIDNLLLR